MRYTGEFKLFTFSKGVANLNSAVIVQPNNITSDSFLYRTAIAGHKGYRISNFYILTQTYMTHLHTLAINSGADAHKGDTIAMLGVHIGLDFKNKTAKFFFVRFNKPLFCITAARCRRPLNETIQHFTYTEITQRSTEIHRRHPPGKILFYVELIRCTTHKFYFLAQRGSIAAKQLCCLSTFQTFNLNIVRN